MQGWGAQQYCIHRE